MRTRVSQSSVFAGEMPPFRSSSFCWMSVHSTSKGSESLTCEGWPSSEKICSVISAEVSPGRRNIWPVCPKRAVMKPPTKMTSSATWTAYAPRRFHAPRSAKTKVAPLFSLTRALRLTERAARAIRSATSAALPASSVNAACCS